MELRRRPNLGMIAFLYAAFYIAGCFIAFGIVWVLIAQTSFQPTSVGLGIIIPMAAAMQCGTWYYRNAGRRPGSGYLWRAAFVMTALAAVISVAQFWIALRLGAVGMVLHGFSFANRDDRTLALIVFVLLMVIVFFANLLGFWSAARGAEKRELRLQRRAAKAAAKNGG